MKERDAMRFKILALSSLMAVAFLAAEAAADPEAQCDIHHRHLLRVALSVAIGQTALDTPTLTGVVEQLWADEGVDIDWVEEMRAATEDRLDAWVVVGRTVAESAHVPPRGDNLARPIVWISTDQAVAQFEQRLSVQMQVPRESARHLLFANGHLIEQLLGYSIAHKLGHTVMGLPEAATGLMNAASNLTPGLTAIVPIGLDPKSRRAVQQRFGVGCAAAR
jgi:hypothetical protein